MADASISAASDLQFKGTFCTMWICVWSCALQVLVWPLPRCYFCTKAESSPCKWSSMHTFWVFYSCYVAITTMCTGCVWMYSLSKPVSRAVYWICLCRYLMQHHGSVLRLGFSPGRASFRCLSHTFCSQCTTCPLRAGSRSLVCAPPPQDDPQNNESSPTRLHYTLSDSRQSQIPTTKTIGALAVEKGKISKIC